MLRYTNPQHLINLEYTNKFNITKVKNVFTFDNIKFEICIISTNNFDLSYKFYFYFYIFSNSFSYINYKLIPSTTKTTNFSIKLESTISSNSKLNAFLYHFILEKIRLLRFKSVTKNFISKNNVITLSLLIPVKLYLQENFISIKTISPLLYDNEKFLLKFDLNIKNLNLSKIATTKSQFKTFFSFWKIIIK